MKSKLFIIILLFLPYLNVFSQSLSKEEIQNIRSSFDHSAQTIAIQNILTGNKDIRSIALNYELQGKIDHYFKYRVKVRGITDQKSSGRCWMFTSMNVLRPIVMDKFNVTAFDFSHNYLYFWDIFEKSNLFF